MKRISLNIVISLVLGISAETVFAQGLLTPPGPPAPTMKTLDQVEPRTPISSATNITQSGSYYLTTNITVTTGNALVISVDNVTLDLNGFTLFSTEASPTGTGILLSGGPRAHVHILNGHIRGNVTVSGGVYSGSGFYNGIAYTSGTQPRNVRVTGVSVSGCQNEGIYLNFGNGTVVESCMVDTVGGGGILANSVADSVAENCGSFGIEGETTANCLGSTTGSGTGLDAASAINCRGYSAGSGTGLNAFYSAVNCGGTSLTTGTGLIAGSASNCQGYSGTGTGLQAPFAINCFGNSGGSGYGLQANNASNCQGNSSSGTGLYAQYIANTCSGYSGSGIGLSANIANSCYIISGSSSISYPYNMP